MSEEIGAAGRAAARFAAGKAQPLVGLLEGSGRTDWSRLAVALSGSGERLDEGVRLRMEATLGHDLGEARIHSGPRVEGLARHLGAEAFTVGNRVFAPPGRLDAAGERGAGLLAHELTHVVQQTSARPLGGPAVTPGAEGQLVQRTAGEPAGGGAGEQQAREVEQSTRQAAGGSRGGAVDLAKLAELVYELMRQEVLLERERLGPG